MARWQRILLATSVLLAAGAGTWLLLGRAGTGASGKAATTAPTPPIRIEAWGDSMLYQDGPALAERFARARNVDFDFHAYPGTPLCPWLNPDLANSIPAVVAARHPDAVVLQFGGAGSSPCAEGWPLGATSADEYHGAGHAEVVGAFRSVIAYLLDHGVDRVEVVTLPVRASVFTTLRPRDAAMRAALREAVAAVGSPRVTFVDPSPAVSAEDGSFAATLPCLPEERRTPGHCHGPVVDGVRSNVVRASDGLHLCDVPWPDTGPPPAPGCPGNGYASGPHRLAGAIAKPLLASLGR